VLQSVLLEHLPFSPLPVGGVAMLPLYQVSSQTFSRFGPTGSVDRRYAPSLVVSIGLGLMNRLGLATPRLLWKLAEPSRHPEQGDQRA
jgi:hypothetical protein